MNGEEDTTPRFDADSAREEWLAIVTDRRRLAGGAILAVILGLAGPFATVERLGAPLSVLYWLLAVALAWVIAAAHVAVLCQLMPPRWSAPLRAALGAALAGPAIMAAIGALNLAVFGQAYTMIDGRWGLALFAGLSAAVALLARLIGGAPAFPPPPPPDRRDPALLRRLPPAKRGRLIRLSMHDHYVEVVTDQGSELLLLRLSDAMQEAAPEEGLQIHRSHWVARAAVQDVRREGGRVALRLSDGSETPVSRARARALADAGWI
ncbi:MAG: LytTR family DNA-binding domain-containing protein [Pseudomonadota bacterium]